MASEKFAAFTQSDARKIAQATRHVLGYGMQGHRYRRQHRGTGGSAASGGSSGTSLTDCGCGHRIAQSLGISSGCAAVATDYNAAVHFRFTLPDLPQAGLSELSELDVYLAHSNATGEECIWKQVGDPIDTTCQGTTGTTDTETGHFELTLIAHSETFGGGAQTLHPKAGLIWVVDDTGDAGVDCGYEAVAFCNEFDPLSGGLFTWQPGNCMQLYGCFCVVAVGNDNRQSDVNSAVSNCANCGLSCVVELSGFSDVSGTDNITITGSITAYGTAAFSDLNGVNLAVPNMGVVYDTPSTYHDCGAITLNGCAYFSPANVVPDCWLVDSGDGASWPSAQLNCDDNGPSVTQWDGFGGLLLLESASPSLGGTSVCGGTAQYVVQTYAKAVRSGNSATGYGDITFTMQRNLWEYRGGTPQWDVIAAWSFTYTGGSTSCDGPIELTYSSGSISAEGAPSIDITDYVPPTLNLIITGTDLDPDGDGIPNAQPCDSDAADDCGTCEWIWVVEETCGGYASTCVAIAGGGYTWSSPTGAECGDDSSCGTCDAYSVGDTCAVPFGTFSGWKLYDSDCGGDCVCLPPATDGTEGEVRAGTCVKLA